MNLITWILIALAFVVLGCAKVDPNSVPSTLPSQISTNAQ